MLGAFIGDIAGSTYEFTGRKFTDLDRIEFLPRGSHFTDDSICTMAIGEWLMNKGSDLSTTLRKFGSQYPGRGYGGNFRVWLEVPTMQAYGSYGNGSAMRVSPTAYVGKTEEEVLDLAKQSADVTHNHPDAVIGAQATALAIFMARKNKSKNEIREAIRSKFGYPLNRTIEEIRETYKWSEKCSHTAPPAIIAALESESFEETIKKAISLGGDADTLACIAGSIAEPLFGIPDAIAKKGMSFLDSHMTDYLTRFYKFVDKTS